MTSPSQPRMTLKTDWLGNAIGTVRVVSVAGEMAGPLAPYLKGSAGILLKLLESVQQVKRNKEDYKQLVEAAVRLLELLHDETGGQLDDIQCERFKSNCLEFERCLREIQQEASIISALPKLKQHFKASEIRARLDEYRQQIVTLRDNFTYANVISLRMAAAYKEKYKNFRSIRRGDLVPLEMLDLSHGIDSDGHRIQLIRARMVTFNNTAVIVKEYSGRDRQKVMDTELSMLSKVAMHPHVLSLFGIIEDTDSPAIVFHGDSLTEHPLSDPNCYDHNRWPRTPLEHVQNYIWSQEIEAGVNYMRMHCPVDWKFVRKFSWDQYTPTVREGWRSIRPELYLSNEGKTIIYLSFYSDTDETAEGDYAFTTYPSCQFPGHRQSLQDTVTLINRIDKIQGRDNILYGGIRGENALPIDSFLRSIVPHSTIHDLGYTEFPPNPDIGTMCISTTLWDSQYDRQASPGLPLSQLKLPARVQSWGMPQGSGEGVNHLSGGWKRIRCKIESDRVFGFGHGLDYPWDAQRTFLAQLGYISNSLVREGWGKWTSLQPLIVTDRVWFIDITVPEPTSKVWAHQEHIWIFYKPPILLDSGVFKPPQAYWSLDSSGDLPMSSQERELWGIPELRIWGEYYGLRLDFDNSVCECIRKLCIACGFNPDTPELARQLHLPVMEMLPRAKIDRRHSISSITEAKKLISSQSS